MFKYIAKQLEQGNEDFGFVFDDDGLNPSSGDFNNTLFIFIWHGGDKLINELADLVDCSAKDLEVYVDEDGKYEHIE